MDLNDEKPEEYKKGKAFFYKRNFIVTPDVLIPRIETEEIICHCEERATKQYSLIADIGCGSGCIGITMAEKFPDSAVYISDISEKTLAVAKQNIQTKNVIPLVSDLLVNYPPDLLFDVIVANLPYIPSGRIPTLQSSVKDYEPHEALDGGPHGTTIINKLLSQIPNHLKPDGLAILEIDDTHALESFNISEDFMGEIKKDQFNRNRFLLFGRISKGQTL